MPKFRKKAGVADEDPEIVIEATQWFKRGDHPHDDNAVFIRCGINFRTEGKVVRDYRRPDVKGHEICPRCRFPMHEHGWIDTGQLGRTVHPGDWIITGDKGYYPCKPDIFPALYESVEPE